MTAKSKSDGRTITTLSSREVYRNYWMRVREDEILRSNGKKGIYGVVEKDDAAIIIPIDEGNGDAGLDELGLLHRRQVCEPIESDRHPRQLLVLLRHERTGRRQHGLAQRDRPGGKRDRASRRRAAG